MNSVMASLLIRCTLFSALALTSVTAQELPKQSGPADFDFEPKLLLNDLPDLPVPGAPFPEAIPADQIPAAIAKLEGSLERAKKNAAFRERLCKAGVLSKLEAEQGEMTVVRLTRDLENARCKALQQELDERRKETPADEATRKAVEEIEVRLAAANVSAQEASKKWDEAVRKAAEIRVWRERKLMALGAGSKSSLKRAEAALQGLTGAPALEPIAEPPTTAAPATTVLPAAIAAPAAESIDGINSGRRK